MMNINHVVSQSNILVGDFVKLEDNQRLTVPHQPKNPTLLESYFEIKGITDVIYVHKLCHGEDPRADLRDVVKSFGVLKCFAEEIASSNADPINFRILFTHGKLYGANKQQDFELMKSFCETWGGLPTPLFAEEEHVSSIDLSKQIDEAEKITFAEAMGLQKNHVTVLVGSVDSGKSSLRSKLLPNSLTKDSVPGFNRNHMTSVLTPTKYSGWVGETPKGRYSPFEFEGAGFSDRVVHSAFLELYNTLNKSPAEPNEAYAMMLPVFKDFTKSFAK